MTGHSLGAGAAALISLKLRDRFKGALILFFLDTYCPWISSFIFHPEELFGDQTSSIKGLLPAVS